MIWPHRFTMTGEQELHLNSIKKAFSEDVDAKYRKGQAEHGGDLFQMTPTELLDNAIEECIDQYVYLITIKQKINRNPM